MKSFLLYSFSFILLVNSFFGCTEEVQENKIGTTTNASQTPTGDEPIIGGGCDGCELMYIGMPENISSSDTNIAWKNGEGQKLLINGVVYTSDGYMPGRNVIIYYWQTDQTGNYTPTDNMDERVKRHGRLRGWVKTDENGSFWIHTIRPAPYPGGNEPAHIHLAIKEPDKDTEYYIDDIVFEDDKLLTEEIRNSYPKRGSNSAIVRTFKQDDFEYTDHEIILGFNIPNYPK